MCGIAGFVGRGDTETLAAMVATIKHRGPDFQGYTLTNNVGFAHARLSILDLSSNANQPFFNPDKSLAITFNGEIYNFQELKQELLALGKYSFTTTSDTEVLLYLFQEYKLGLFEKINGMFAFAIYDFTENKLLLARDRMGKKPLYYGVFQNTIIFASEVKAILAHPLVAKEIDLNALNEYLTFDYVPTPHTIFKNIYKLEAAHYLTFKDGAINEKRPYWRMDLNEESLSFSEALSRFDQLLNDAVRMRMIADVPIGVFLSGGLDSSSVAYYAQKNSSNKINTYSIGFSESSFDESNYAKLVANHLGTEHHSLILSAEESLSLIPYLFGQLDEPFADPSIIPTYFLSKYTRTGVTVALGGDGSDELMAGYPTFISNYFTGAYSAFPGWLKGLFKYSASLLPVSDNNISFDFKVSQFLRGFELSRQYTSTLWLGGFLPSEKRKLFSSEALSKLTNGHGLHIIDKYLSEIPAITDSFRQLQYIYCKTYLLDDILVKVDRASMYNSLEVRAPFLDFHLVQFLTALPQNYKLHRFNVKYILKQMMRGKLPDVIIDRPKKGFGIPLSYWLRHQLKPVCNELLSEAALSKHQLFNSNYVNTLKNDHFSGKRNNRKLLWNLMMFQGWYNNFMG